jgi:hypothetical protein
VAINAGARLGVYQVLGLLGTGGMGEVYRGFDTRLRREVAIKILPETFANDPERIARLEREARLLAALNHPHIATIYGLEETDGARALVMELIEGPTLADRVATGPMPLEEAMTIVRQIAEAMEAAHEKGIIHRDLKPANVKATGAGVVKVLDFGLAKALREVSPARDLSQVPTVTTPATLAGMIVGTPAYMSPAQVRGKPFDERDDIWAFGCLLYEILTGRPAFPGETLSDTIAAVLDREPDWQALPPSTPAGVRRLLHRCLEKNPQRRLHDIADARIEIEDVLADITAAPLTTTVAPPVRALTLTRAVAGTASLVALAAIVMAFLLGWRIGAGEGLNSALASPSFKRLTFRQGFIWAARFAPDSQHILYSASWDGGAPQIYLTSPESPESSPLALPSADLLAVSASGELAISMSPVPGRNLYIRQGVLARVQLTGVSPRPVLERVRHADWGPGGADLAVVVVRGRRLYGLTDDVLEFPIGNELHRGVLWQPRVSPSGDAVAFFEGRGGGVGLALIDREGTKTELGGGGWPDPGGLAWAPGGNELWFGAAESGQTSSLYAVDRAGHRRLVAHAPGILELHDLAPDGRALVTRLDQRSLIEGLPPGESVRRDLSWFDRSVLADVSHDGRTMLFGEFGDGGGPSRAVYHRKTDGSPATRLGEGVPLTLSPDGRWAVVVESVRQPQRLWLYPTGPGDRRALSTGPLDRITAADWFPDGQRLLIEGSEPGRSTRLYVLALSGDGPPRPETPEGFVGGLLSPDGARIATVSEDAVVLWPVGGQQPARAVGTSGSDVPIEWTIDGRGLYVFRQGEVPARVFLVDLQTGARRLWREIAPSNRAGVSGLTRIAMARNAPGAFFYSYVQTLHELYLADGLR